MKALFKAERAAGLELMDRPDPTAAADEVVIRVLRTGICGTDLHIHRWDDWAASAIDAPLDHAHLASLVERAQRLSGDATAIRSIRQFEIRHD